MDFFSVLKVPGLLQTALLCETFYRQYAIPDSSVQGHRGLITPTIADFEPNFQSWGLFPSWPCSSQDTRRGTLRCLLLTSTSHQNSVYFSKAAPTVSQTCKGALRPATFQPPRALVTVSRVQLNLALTMRCLAHLEAAPTLMGNRKRQTFR